MASDLISRLESATEGSRELDWRIALAIGHPSMRGARDGFFPPFVAGSPADREIPAYSISIDAALTLVPKDANCHGFDLTPRGVEAYWSRNCVGNGHWYSGGETATSIPIAFCIAALKARGL